ncbi:4Fe-4S dicluster domain-containing protein [Ktedonobacter robiniae]|uniref:4Fe-4S ferredoxin n=1 Tax=Ktedonobacter robiniae TaxID=2778365 RepID=A0ABQ3UYR4_9CHLR|nr:4Fe-4S dicluster domain-containing protein [Ktedonobacter robiniae]GHO58016.1 4Fe-4S ferredoxin [Ktedonobacter robiniae]
MEQYGFFTDTTLCIGCKACEVACKQWNQLPADGYKLSGYSYDNTVSLSATTWRHVAFVERPRVPDGMGKQVNWLMMSDVCKHCEHPGCMEACPTGAIIRNEFGNVYVQPDICNGCGYCVPSYPFGVIGRNEETGLASKCTLCYDRQKDGIEPACAKACPTDSIRFGKVGELQELARKRVTTLHERGETSAYLYGVDEDTSVGDLNAFFLLTDRPSVYNLPEKPRLPQENIATGFVTSALTAAFLALATTISLWSRKK